MTRGERYRMQAAEFDDKACKEADPAIRREFERLAASYRRLAEHADRTSCEGGSG